MKKGTDLLEEFCTIAEEQKADTIIYAYSDCPFLNVELTKKLLSSHEEYKSEYTFADGYPYGFCPEILNVGTAKILLELSKTTQTAEGEKEVNRDTLFNIIKTDINSFDVESIIAPEDWRLYRFAFHCGTKDNFLQCRNLFETADGDEKIILDAEKLSNLAAKSVNCLKTVPGFYNIQITGNAKNTNCIYYPALESIPDMQLADFENLVDKIAAYSENAVISLSAWCEPLYNENCLQMIQKVLSYDGLSVFMETNGLEVTEDFCSKLSQIVNSAQPRTNGWSKVMIAIVMDAFSAQTYKSIHKNAAESDFSTAVSAVAKLQTVIPGCVYPQFVRMNENESELESFYRYWNEKTNASGGNLIIQKYNSLAGDLPQRKVADLTPVERNVCWHLRRDMTILANGDVPLCHSCVQKQIIGNILEKSIETVWHELDAELANHINKKYCDKCGKCDEYYTFNF